MTGVSVISKSVGKILGNSKHLEPDLLAVEEPLEIRLKFHRHSKLIEKNIAVTMRTPGHDFELVTGFLMTEGIISGYSAVEKIYHCPQTKSPAEAGNVIIVKLKDDIDIDLKQLERHFYTSSSCGVCGKSSIDAISTCVNPLWFNSSFMVAVDIIQQLPQSLAKNQLVFGHTGSIHAAGLFDLEGNLMMVREDVGRHNALDKLIGAQLYQDKLPLSKQIVLLSGRISFELVQKALMAGIQVVAAIGAPSSLAVQLAEKHGVTLIGFVKDNRCNIYCGEHRIKKIH